LAHPLKPDKTGRAAHVFDDLRPIVRKQAWRGHAHLAIVRQDRESASRLNNEWFVSKTS
jgi:hypothetical protein